MNTPLRLLLVEDSEPDALLIVEELRGAGYTVDWTRVDTAAAMRQALADGRWDVVVSDYRMPRFSAPDALNLLKESGLDLPFILVSGTIGEETAVAILRAGAHDFLLKSNFARLPHAVDRELRDAAIRRERREAIEALKHQEAYFRALTESATEMISVVARDGTFLYGSPSARRLLGGDRNGQSTFASIHPDDLPAIREMFAQLVQHPDLKPVVEARFRHEDGSWRLLEATGQNLLADPYVAGLVITARDITEQRVAEQALRAQEGLFRSMIENASDMVTIISAGGTIRYASPSIARILGVNRTGQNVLTFIHPDDQATIREMMRRLLADPSATQRGEFRYLHADGSWRVLQGVGRNLIADPDIAGIVVNSRDVTESKAAEDERRRAEEALARSEAHFRALIEHSADMIMVLDRAEIIRYASASFARILGYDPAEVIGAVASGFVHPDDLVKTHAALAGALSDPTTLPNVTIRLRHKDGRWLHIETTTCNLLANPDVAGIVLNAHDVTERHQLEAQYLQSQKMEAVGKLAGGVAHDFNNLLTVIKAHTEFLLEGISPADARFSDVEEIRDAANRAATLTRQLLAFSRRQVLQPTALSLDDVVREVEKMVRRLIGEDIALVVEPRACPGAIVADRGQIEQVIVNLCVNARDAMPDGGRLTIATSCLDSADPPAGPGAAPRGWVELRVSDTGVGMTPEVQAKIFEPFFTTKANGTGLGLATVYGIVQQSQGSVTAESEPGRGTTFRVRLPMALAAAAAAPVRGLVATSRGHETVLLAEDDAAVRAVAKRSLEQSGYTVLEAADGAEATRLFKMHRGAIDLLLTDVVMPNLSGRELAERLTALDPGLPVIYVSGYTADRMSHYGPADPGTHLIEKPFSPEALVRRVREVLDANLAG